MVFNFSPTCQITGLDTIYQERFGKLETGTFVEIGAFDGETHSNTSGLADAGWRGVYVEPVPDHVVLCMERHKTNDVSVLEALVGNVGGVRSLNVAGELSSVIKKPDAMYKKAGLEDLYNQEDQHKVIQVPQVTLNYVMQTFDIKPGFELLVLDCEGAEWPVLSVFDIAVYKPKMVIVEMHEESPEWQAIDSIKKDTGLINNYMLVRGYETIHKDAINTIFYRTSK